MMKKNSQLHLWIETELIEKLRKQAEENNLPVAELCRLKLRENSQLDRIESFIKELDKKIKC